MPVSIRRRDGSGPRRAATFRSLRNRDFRLFAMGHSVSIVGTWCQRVALDWLVLDVGGSGIALGVCLALQFGPLLPLGMWGGLLVDRHDRRTMLMLSQVAQALIAVAITVIVLLDAATLGIVMAACLALGLVTVVDSPARHTFVADLVEPADYLNAQALNGSIASAGRLVGPAVAGVLLVTVGLAGAFVVNAVSYVAVLASMAFIRTRRSTDASNAAGRGQVWQAVQYAWRRPELQYCLLVVVVVAVFGQNFRVVLPVLAQDIFDGSADAYAWMTAAMGAGALVGSLVTASREQVTLAGVALWSGAFGLLNLVLALSSRPVMVLAVLAGLGFANITLNTLARSLMLARSDPAMHGRMMALHAMAFIGVIPVGAPLVGLAVDAGGPALGLLLAAVAAVAVAALALAASRSEKTQ